MKKYLLTGITVLALLFLLWPGTSDEELIRKIFEDVKTNGSFEGEIHPIERIAQAKETTKNVIDTIVITVVTTERDRVVVKNKKELQQKIIAARTHLAQLAVGLFDIRVELSGDTAKVFGIARGMGRSNGREDYFLEEHKVEIDLFKEDGEWKIVSAKNTNPIEWPYE